MKCVLLLFFCLCISTQFDNDGGSGLDEPADDYDALNDETFGSAVNDDWEGDHENLVLLDTNGNSRSKKKDETDDGDLGDLGKWLQCVGFYGFVESKIQI